MYSARSKADGQQYAIKVMDRVKIKPASIVREFTVLENVGQHPSVVGYFGTYKTATTVSFVLEHMQGGELFERLIAEGAFEESQARYTFQRVAQGLAYLHKTGIIHRDLKPENLLLKTALPGDAKIADFGLSQLIKPGERLLKVCGTWAYAAPEMSSSKKPGYSTRFDTWSFGVILYVVLSGSHPFDPQGGLPVAKIKANARAARFSFDQPEWATVSDVAKDFVRRLIVKDQRKRLSSKQMLKHPWLKNVPEPTTRYRLTEDGEKIVERIRAAGSSDDDSSATPSDFEEVEAEARPKGGKGKKAAKREGTSHTADPFGGEALGTLVAGTSGSHLYGPSTHNGKRTGTISADSGFVSPRPPAAASRSHSRDNHTAQRDTSSGAAPQVAATRPPESLPQVSATGEVYNSGASRRQPRAVRAVDVAMPVEQPTHARPRAFARPPVKSQAASTYSGAGMPPTAAALASKASQNAAVVAGKKHRQAVGKRLGRAFYKAPPITTGTVTTSVGSQDTAMESISDMTAAQRTPHAVAGAGGGSPATAADAGTAAPKYPQSSARRVRKQNRSTKDARHFRQSRGEDVMAADIAAANARTATNMTDNDSVVSAGSAVYSVADIEAVSHAKRQHSLPANLSHKLGPPGSASSELQPLAERSRTNAGQANDSSAPIGGSPALPVLQQVSRPGAKLATRLLPASHESFNTEQEGNTGGSIDIADSASFNMHAPGPGPSTSNPRSMHRQQDLAAGASESDHEALRGSSSSPQAPASAAARAAKKGRALSPIAGKDRARGMSTPLGLPPRSPVTTSKFTELRG